ncbi:DUF4192 family protein [Agromyces italicus]|uniref:DUF4192 family protein n=1 Tax=Agromyces italicus TaxID=279572 RepID=UPI0003B3ADF7|nr:DUF4192 family protein [Agromyces italicus]
MTTIIRAGSAQEFLALVPSLAGFEPMRSLVCVAFVGHRTVGVLRHDLPRRPRDRSTLVAAVVATLCRMPGVDGVVPVVYTDAGFADRGEAPERRLVELFAARATEAGFAVRDELCVANDGWGSYRDPALGATGHPLALIAASVPGRGADDGRHESAVHARIPEGEPRRATAVARALERLETAGPGGAEFTRLGDDLDPVELVEHLLEPGTVPARAVAWFLHLAARPAFRDGMMLQFAFGPLIGAAAHDDAMESLERAELAGMTVDELVSGELAAGSGEAVSELLARLIMGQTGLRPERPRVERAIEVLRGLIAVAPESHRVGPLCIMAWLLWGLGRGSAAGVLLDAALELDPAHTMAGLLDRYLGSGALPEWAFTSPREADAG